MGRLSRTEAIARGLLRHYLPNATFAFNIRPTTRPGAKSWQSAQARRFDIERQGLELDVYVPTWRTAFEIQGIQHGRPVDFFTKGDFQVFLDQQERDDRKVELCRKQSIELHALTIFDLCPEKFDPFIKRLMSKHGLYEQYRRTTPPRSLYVQAKKLADAKAVGHQSQATRTVWQSLWEKITRSIA